MIIIIISKAHICHHSKLITTPMKLLLKYYEKFYMHLHYINRFTNNFGVLGILDHLHGTDANFRASKQYERHYMSLSLTPLRQLHPDDPKHGKSCLSNKAE